MGLSLTYLYGVSKHSLDSRYNRVKLHKLAQLIIMWFSLMKQLTSGVSKMLALIPGSYFPVQVMESWVKAGK